MVHCASWGNHTWQWSSFPSTAQHWVCQCMKLVTLVLSGLDLPIIMAKGQLLLFPTLLSYLSLWVIWNLSENVHPHMKLQNLSLELHNGFKLKFLFNLLDTCWPFSCCDQHTPCVCYSILQLLALGHFFIITHFPQLQVGQCWSVCKLTVYPST